MSHNLTLAITKIGDLLINNKITDAGNGESIDNISLLIPEYQRPYKWTAKNVNQLLDDIIYAMNENKEVYRVGTLILHRDESGYNIVDGQQRTITFSLMLKALGAENIPFLEQKLTDNVYSRTNIANNFRVLKRSCKNSDKKREEICEFIKNNCELIVVITDDISEAFQFFDSQNARGRKLYPHDLLKAYHLREMGNVDANETEKTVRVWEDLNQKELAQLFSDYLYRMKEWIKGNRSYELNEHNIDLFKGVTGQDKFPYAQYYKGAYAYAENFNNSEIPFVAGMNKLSRFQLNAPIIAGKPFFDYAKHYFKLLADIRDNDKYSGYYINDNKIIKTLNGGKYKKGVGNGIARLLLDTAILLYIDRFCPEKPGKTDTEFLERFVELAFIWAYSLRAQYQNLGWKSAQNYIMGKSEEKIRNSFNLYKIIVESDSPAGLFSTISDKLIYLTEENIQCKEEIEAKNDAGEYENYISFFAEFDFLSEKSKKI